MEPIRRRLFAGVSVLSLILCLATVGLWVRSYSSGDQLTTEPPEGSRPQRYFQVVSDSGVIALITDELRPGASRVIIAGAVKGQWCGVYWYAFQPLYVPGVASFRYFGGNRVSSAYRQLAAPHWFFVTFFALAPTYWLLGPRRRLARRRKLGLCEQCGYDLRATPARCPECGMTVGAAVSTPQLPDRVRAYKRGQPRA